MALFPGASIILLGWWPFDFSIRIDLGGACKDFHCDVETPLSHGRRDHRFVEDGIVGT